MLVAHDTLALVRVCQNWEEMLYGLYRSYQGYIGPAISTGLCYAMCLFGIGLSHSWPNFYGKVFIGDIVVDLVAC